MPSRRQPDPTKALMDAAAALPDVEVGTSCNQTSYKIKKKAFLYVGPGAKGVGFKAMFKLDRLAKDAQTMAKSDPDSFQVGTGNWVTARFSIESPLLKKIWAPWLKESYAIASGPAPKKAK